jgi:Domain of unknown function (DUF1887)
MQEIVHLVLIGGRLLPNILTVKALQPSRIVPLASIQSQHEWNKHRAIYGKYSLVPDSPLVANAFDLAELCATVNAALALYPNARWVGNITCGTTLMSIAVYQTLRDARHTVWYLHSANASVVTLAGEPPTAAIADAIFQIPFEIYAETYQRVVQPGVMTPRSPALHEFITELAHDLTRAKQCANFLEKTHQNARPVTIPPQLADFISRGAALCGGARVTSTDTGHALTLQTQKLRGFFTGTWLEYYAWHCAHEADVFDDIHMDIKIPNIAGATNQIDLAAMRSAMLLLGECKTGPFAADDLAKLDSLANMLGGQFVTRILITGCTSAANQKSWQSFYEQARERKVVVVTGDDLPRLTQILRREALTPTYTQR